MLLLTLLLAADPQQQTHRLANDEPEVRIDARGRTGICDVLRFSPDGRTLFAAGEDKVVHRWAVADDRLTRLPPLAWNTLRERRGAIYAAALDPLRNQLAVAGFGKMNADLVAFDLAAGRIVAAAPRQTADRAIWSLGYSPDGAELLAGDEAGRVWRWRPNNGPAELAAAGPGEWVTWVGHLPGGPAFARGPGVYRLADGAPLHTWGPAVKKPGAGGRTVDKVVASDDGRVLAARPFHGFKGNGIEVWWPAEQRTVSVLAPQSFLPARSALSGTGRRLAVGYIDQSAPPTGFEYTRLGEVRVYDLTTAPPTQLAAVKLPACPDQIAFHPDGDLLAFAEPDTHATTLWRLGPTGLTKVFDEVGDTPSIWAVGVNADDWHLSFKTTRAASPAHPNKRAVDAEWTTFNLRPDQRGWADPKPPEPPLDTLAGWQVRLADETAWQAVAPDGVAHRLPADPGDDLPRCFTFLKGPTGQAVWLAVGHLWGVTVYDLQSGRPERVRKLTGHAGPVTAIAPTNDGRGLVTAGADHMIALWNLADFEHQAVLGLAVAEVGGKAVVEAVADGSPADEAGLSKGFEVRALIVGGRTFTTPTDIAAAVRAARPGVELAFADVRVPGRAGLSQCKTQCLHRPTAKFVPFKDGNWVLYTYRQCFYDSSADGDRAIQWVVSKNTPGDDPDLFPVGDFRQQLRKPEAVSAVLSRARREPARPDLAEKYPPAVRVALDKPRLADGEVTATITVTPRRTPAGRVNAAEVVELWLNGHRLVATPRPPAGQRPGEPFTLTETVKASDLRAGRNQVSALVLARDGGWGTSADAELTVDRAQVQRKLFAVSVGIDDYGESGLSSLSGAFDAERLRAALETVRGVGGFAAGAPGDIRKLVNQDVTRDGVLEAVEAVGQRAGPDDLLVLALSGHGVLGNEAGELQFPDTPGRRDAVWYFATPHHKLKALALRKGELRDPQRVQALFLTNRQLLATLGRIGCPTLLILDSCHAGRAAQPGGIVMATKNAPDQFRHHGFGPAVLAACDANELANEVVAGGVPGAVFTTAVVQGLTLQFAQADADGDGRLTGDEFFRFVRDRTREGAALLNRRQTAVATPGAAGLSRLLLAERKK